MPVSLKFNTQNQFLNGAVDSSSNPSIENPGAANIFDKTFSILTAQAIALKMFEGKNELNYETNLTADNSGVVEALEGELELLEDDLTRATEDEDKLALQGLIEEKTNDINQKKALIDSTRETDLTGAIIADDPASEVYNPDFPINSVSFSYVRRGDDRSDHTDINARGPNVGFPNDNDIITPPRDRGFGNNYDEGSIQDSYLDSIQIIRKYQD